jgi:hypothetical protein
MTGITGYDESSLLSLTLAIPHIENCVMINLLIILSSLVSPAIAGKIADEASLEHISEVLEELNRITDMSQLDEQDIAALEILSARNIVFKAQRDRKYAELWVKHRTPFPSIRGNQQLSKIPEAKPASMPQRDPSLGAISNWQAPSSMSTTQSRGFYSIKLPKTSPASVTQSRGFYSFTVSDTSPEKPKQAGSDSSQPISRLPNPTLSATSLREKSHIESAQIQNPRIEKSSGSNTEKRYPCELCFYQGSRKKSLVDHMKTHRNLKRSLEDSSYPNNLGPEASSLSRKVPRTDNPEPCEAPNLETSFSPFLNELAQVDIELQNASSREEALAICQVCGRGFQNKSNLFEHTLEIHEKPFSCSVCGERFAKDKSRESHERRKHDLSKPFSCPICKFRFKSDQYLVVHFQTQHPGEGYGCRDCKRWFILEEDLLKHREKHSPDNRYFCQECIYGFPSKSALNLHRKRKHSPDNRSSIQESTPQMTSTQTDFDVDLEDIVDLEDEEPQLPLPSTNQTQHPTNLHQPPSQQRSPSHRPLTDLPDSLPYGWE